MTLRGLVAVLVLSQVGCVRPDAGPSAGAAPPAGSIRRVAVLPPANRTGDPLLVSGTSLLEHYAFDAKHVSVDEVLAAALREELARRGLDVVPPSEVTAALDGRVASTADAAAALAKGRLDASVLFVGIDRWEPNAGTHPTFVVVALDAALVDPASGTVLWSKSRRARPVPTPGAATLGAAYDLAVRRVATELLTWWGTGAP